MTEGLRDEDLGAGGIGRRAATGFAWSLVALSVLLLLGGIALSVSTRSTDLALPYGGEAELNSAVISLATLLTFSVVGAIIASRHPRNAIGWLYCSIGLFEGLNALAGGYAEFWLGGGSGSRSLGETAAWFSSWSWVIVISLPTSLLLLLFPDGRLPSSRWSPVAWCAGLGFTGYVASYAFAPGPLEDFPQITNPYGIDSPIVGMVGVAAGAVAVGSMVASAVSLIVRLRRAGRVERQQIKWLAYGGAVVVGTVLIANVAFLWSATVGLVIISGALLGLPFFTGIAIVKYRLYDIDILINRTLVYGSLTAALVTLYFGGIVVLQRIFIGLIGHQSALAVVASTLLIAALFDPLRRRVQMFVDRRFYRRKYDARKTLEAFNARLREETDLEALNNELVGVVRETMQPAHVSLWLRSSGIQYPSPEPGGPEIRDRVCDQGANRA